MIDADREARLDRSPVLICPSGPYQSGCADSPDDRSDRKAPMRLRAIVDVATVLPPGPDPDQGRAPTGPPRQPESGDPPGRRAETGRRPGGDARPPARPAAARTGGAIP